MSEKLSIKENKLTIKVNVAGRLYSLSIKRGEEKQEELIRKAAEKINNKIKLYRDKFAGKDTFDLLSMSSLQIIKELIAEQQEANIDSIVEDLKDLSEEIDRIQEV
jgi:cell division protein ZapA (FtsZ GTPase activity inhibitor)